MRYSVVASIVLLGCVVRPPKPAPTKVPAPVVSGRSLSIPSVSAGLAALDIEADWVVDGDRYCARGGDARMPTPSGAIELREVSICVTQEPVSMIGEATVTIPALGFLERAGLQSDGRRARITFGLGSQLGTLDVGGRPMKLEPAHYYMKFDYHDGLDFMIGNMTVKAPGSSGTLIFAPQEPLLYLAGTMAAPYFPREIKDAALGVSPAGRLPYAPVRPLRDGRGAIDGRTTGHLLIKGDVPVSGYPAVIRGEVVWNIDADRDGIPVFAGSLRDYRYAANATVVLGYEKSGFNFEFEVANGSVLYDASLGTVGHLYVSAGDTGGLFEGTPLAVFQPQTPKRDFWGFFRSPDDFAMHATIDSKVAGFAMTRTIVDLRPSGIAARGRLVLPASMGEAELQGALSTSGLDMRGRANLQVGGFKLADANVKLGSSGVGVAGTLAIPAMGNVAVSGAIEPNGTFDLAGKGTLSPVGLKLANANVRVGARGADIRGSVNVLGTGFAVRGMVAPSGKFSLTGRATANLALLRGTADLTIHPRGFRTTFTGQVCLRKGVCKTLAGYELDTRGRACIKFPKPLKPACIRVLGRKK